eukprot:2904572-Pyramimonas_sp.AAC.1
MSTTPRLSRPPDEHSGNIREHSGNIQGTPPRRGTLTMSTEEEGNGSSGSSSDDEWSDDIIPRRELTRLAAPSATRARAVQALVEYRLLRRQFEQGGFDIHV